MRVGACLGTAPILGAPLLTSYGETTIRVLSLAAVLAAPLAAQVQMDAFNYPNGNVVPGWTQQRGVWQVQNGRLSQTSASFWSYITKNGTTGLTSVIDGEFFYGPTPHTQFAGLVSRHRGGNLDSNLLTTKIQDNGARPTSIGSSPMSARSRAAASSPTYSAAPNRRTAAW